MTPTKAARGETAVKQAPSGHNSTLAWANNAMILMADNGIPPTPAHYQVWYTYASGEVPALNHLVDERKSQKGALSAAFSQQLYTRFFTGAEHEALMQQTNQHIQSELDAVISKLRSAETDTSHFGNVLSGYSDDIAGATDIHGIKSFVTELLKETKEMEHKARTLESELKSSSDEINRLKNNLEVARNEALTDQLTGVGNRKLFDKTLVVAAEEANSRRHGFSLLFGDIDHFKKFNDTWGHKLGDHVLKLVAMQMKNIVGERGTTARYGGEEFAIILPKVALADALTMAESLRLAISSKQMKTKTTGVTIGRVTMSFGVAEYIPGEEIDAFVERTDGALYAAKAAGRNRAQAAEAPKMVA